jgi:hypothetical protein
MGQKVVEDHCGLPAIFPVDETAITIINRLGGIVLKILRWQLPRRDFIFEL